MRHHQRVATPADPQLALTVEDSVCVTVVEERGGDRRELRVGPMGEGDARLLAALLLGPGRRSPQVRTGRGAAPSPAGAAPFAWSARAPIQSMRTLVISDLHLGARSAKATSCAVRSTLRALLGRHWTTSTRVVLLGDTIELLEGRPKPCDAGNHSRCCRRSATRLGRDREVVVVPGQPRPCPRPPMAADPAPPAQAHRPGVAGPGLHSSTALKAMTDALRPARVQVRYPGVWLGDGVWATHGHYLDRHLFPSGSTGVLLGRVPEGRANAEDYETAAGPSAAAVQGLVAASLPGLLGEPLDRAAGLARSASITMLPLATKLLGGGVLAPLSAGALGFQFRRAGLPAMAEVALRLNVRAEHVIFGHLHRAGPRFGDHVPEWTPRDAQAFTNSGCWVYEPLLLAGARPPHPYWPGGAVLVEDGAAPVALGLLDGLTERDLA